jgi:Trk-type K+ transport system membrane component
METKKMVFSHIGAVAFMVLGLAMVKLMTNLVELLAKNYNNDPDDDVFFYWPHTAFCFITLFTIMLFWWTCYPLTDLNYFPNDGWNLGTYVLFCLVPFLMYMISEILTPRNHDGKSLDLKDYYYQYHRVILGLAWLLQVALIGNLFVFFQGELYSTKVLGRVIMLCVMFPMVISANRRIHEIGMGIFFIGFIYTIIKYHIFMA